MNHHVMCKMCCDIPHRWEKTLNLHHSRKKGVLAYKLGLEAFEFLVSQKQKPPLFESPSADYKSILIS